MKLKTVTIIVVALAAVAVSLCLLGCNNQPASKSDPLPNINSATTQTADALAKSESMAPVLSKQDAELKQAQADEASAKDSVTKAKAQGKEASISGKSIPAVVSKLSDQSGTLDDAYAKMLDLNNQLTQARTDNSELTDTNAGITAELTATKLDLAQAASLAKQSNDEKLAAEERATKAEKFIAEHKNDFWGEGVHRFFRALSWTLIITLLVLLIAAGVLGCIYGVPKITKPALTIGEKILNALQLVLGYVWKFICTAFPWVGHEIYHLWENFHVLKQGATVVKVAVPTPTPAPLAGSAPPSPELIAALRRRGVAV